MLLCDYTVTLTLQAIIFHENAIKVEKDIEVNITSIIRNSLQTQENEIHCETIPLNHTFINIH